MTQQATCSIRRVILHSVQTAIFLGVLLVVATSATAQTFHVIHAFTGDPQGDDGQPGTGLSIDQAGNLYGTTFGSASDGIVFKMSKQGDTWRFETLYRFTGGIDGYSPNRVVLGPDGRLYGTTPFGGIGVCPSGCGKVFRLAPQPTFCRSATCYWTETVLYNFGGSSDPTDGANPRSDLIFDSAGGIYGTTYSGGGMDDSSCYTSGCGSVFELSPSQGTWLHTTLYSFGNGYDHNPIAGLIFDASGNLYGTSYDGIGREPYGAIFQLTPGVRNWSRAVLHSFSLSEGWGVWGDLISDRAGNFYGATANDGSGGKGAVFELSPSANGWNFQVLYSFTGGGNGGPFGPLSMDQLGNLYGTTYSGGDGANGNIFKLTPSNGSWIYTSLHDFTGFNGDGANPISNVVIDAAGNLYGTTTNGGINNINCTLGCGVVWEITP